ncbi:unnamed protein product [Nezara viridula]|uniref:Neuropeptide n=1 Tax=Nezara viridula TaxID=85310 RepID=A0A9P0E5F7_NEZVI|nr:unnamed protein product [Nezara viridula]
MAKVWLFIVAVTTVFISTEMASVEILSTPTKVIVMKPMPHQPDMKLGRTSWDSISKKAKEKKSTNLITETKGLNKTMNENKSSEHPEINDWPSVFVLKPDPTNPVVCYSGKSLNIHKNNHDDLEISSIKEAMTNDTDSSARNNKKFVLSSDPEYPVICQEINIPSLAINNETAEENSTISNVSCIRRDYEQNISAIFINKVGPIQSALNIFNSTIPYGVFNVENVESIGEIKMLNDTIVNCEEYGIMTGDKGLSSGTVASLLGVG